ncbi:MAG: tetratricopeptide repeat protein [Myxococcales bacterium]|nr:tetratricopeptide repeat protein [Myxococcales bacterium]
MKREWVNRRRHGGWWFVRAVVSFVCVAWVGAVTDVPTVAAQPTRSGADRDSEAPRFTEEARRRYRDVAMSGEAAFNAGDFAAARRIWGEARTIWPNPRIYRLLGRVAQQLGDYPEAVRMYRLALTAPDAGNPLDPPRRRELEEALLPDVERRVGELLLERDPADAVVEIDGEPVRADAPVLLAPGTYTLVARRPGFEPLERGIEVRAGSREPVRVALSRLAGEASGESEAAAPPATDGPSPTLPAASSEAVERPRVGLTGPIVLFGVAIAGALAFGVSGTLALHEDARLADDCGANVGARCADEELERLQRRALAADIGWMTATVALVAGVTWLSVALRRGRRATALRVAPWVHARAGGVLVRGTVW